MMTKKDYERIAAIIRGTYDEAASEPVDDSWAREIKLLHATRDFVARDTIAHIANALADYMEYDNPNFDRSRFLVACGGTNDGNAKG